MKIDLLEKDLLYIINLARQNENVITLDYMDTNFEVLGIDSIEFIKIIILIEEKYDFEFPDEYIVSLSNMNVKELALKVEQLTCKNMQAQESV